MKDTSSDNSLQHNAHKPLPPFPTTPASESTATAAQKDETDLELVRVVHRLGVWLNRQALSGQLASTMDAISAKLDEILDRLQQDRTRGQLMSIKAAAQYLSLSERTIRDRIALREWPAYRSGTAVRVDPDEIRQCMAKKGW